MAASVHLTDHAQRASRWRGGEVVFWLLAVACALLFPSRYLIMTDIVRLARANHAKAGALADMLSKIKGVELATPNFFNEFAVRLSKPAAGVVDALLEKKIIAGVPASRLWPHERDLRDVLILTATETVSDEDCDALVKALSEVL